MKCRPLDPHLARTKAQAPRWFALLALAGTALAATHAPSRPAAEDKLVFDPKVPSKVTKDFVVEHHLALQTLKLEDNGVEQLIQRGLNLDTKLTVRTVDQYLGCAGGRPTILRRLIDDANLHVDVTFREGSGSDKVGTDAIDAKSPFEGISTVFTWIPEENGYGRFYDEREGDEEFLPNLAEDLDLRALLPGKAVSPGDEWKIEPALLMDWVAPGGDIPMQFSRKKDDRFVRTLTLGVGGGLSLVFGGEVKGTISARYDRRETQGDASLAVIALSVDVQTDRDQTLIAQNMISPEELLDGVLVRRSAVKWKMKGEGTARWNMTANRFESLELAGGEEVAYDLELSTARGGKSLQNMVFSGGIRVTGQATPGGSKAKPKDKARIEEPSQDPLKDSKDER